MDLQVSRKKDENTRTFTGTISSRLRIILINKDPGIPEQYI
jgi:hypothetical protein